MQEVRSDELIDCLTEIWRRSVKKSHLFLSDQEIGEIEKYVPAARGSGLGRRLLTYGIEELGYVNCV